MAYRQVASGTVEAAGDGSGSIVAVVTFVLVDDVDLLLVAEPAAGSEVLGGAHGSYKASLGFALIISLQGPSVVGDSGSGTSLLFGSGNSWSA